MKNIHDYIDRKLTLLIVIHFKVYCWRNRCQRPYHDKRTGSRLITEVKNHRAQSVLGRVTTWEHRVPLALIFVIIYLF